MASEEQSTAGVPRLPGWMIARPGEQLSIERLRLRMSAYV